LEFLNLAIVFFNTSIFYLEFVNLALVAVLFSGILEFESFPPFEIQEFWNLKVSPYLYQATLKFIVNFFPLFQFAMNFCPLFLRFLIA